MEILPGPGKLMRWSVPDGTRDTYTVDLINDNLVISTALLDDQTWGLAQSEILIAPDPISGLTDAY